jgi:predicted molibdopterin-dependent oxidoreductase YjgC
MCIIEIQGRPNTSTACTTPAEPGMVIHNNTPRLQALRAELLQMLLADHPASCLFCLEKSHCDECMITLHKAGVTTGCRSCPKDGQCQLQDLVEKIGLTGVDYPVRYRLLKVEKNDPFFDRDYNLCILCGRCVRVCEKLHFAGSIAYTKRGTQTVVGTAFNRTHLAAGCKFCGACVEVCPTGALSEKTRKWDGKPEEETVTTCPLCSIGCQIRLLSKNGRVIGSLPDHLAGVDCLCVKGRFGITELVNHPTRLTEPQKAMGGRQVRISWEETIRIAAEKLSSVTPDRFEMVVSPHCSLESLHIARKLTRLGMKSNNIHTKRINGYTRDTGEVFDLVRQSQPLSTTVAEASTIVCLGLESEYNQAGVEVMLHQAKMGGASLVTALCGEGGLGRFADLYLLPTPGNETSLISELASQISKLQNLNEDHGRNLPSPVEQAAHLLYKSIQPVIIAGPAVFNHPDRQRLLKAINALVRISGAQVVVLPEQADLISMQMDIPGQDGQPNSPNPRVLYLLGENIDNLQNAPGRPPFVIFQNIYPPTAGLNPDLILPTTAFSEEDGSLIDYAGRVHALHRAVSPPGQALPGWEILCRIARKMGLAGFDFTSAEDVWAEMAGLPGRFQVNSPMDRSSISNPTPIESAALYCPNGHSAVIEKHFSFDLQLTPDTYLGFPLALYVQGLRQLAPGKTRNGDG